MTSKLRSLAVGALAALMSWGAWAAESKYNLPTPQSEVAREIFDLHILIMWVCVGIFIVVFVIKLPSSMRITSWKSSGPSSPS